MSASSLQLHRNKRLWINNQENLPVDIAVMTGGVVTCMARFTEEGNANVFGYLFIVYTVARFAWFACYKRKLQPFRTISFGLTKLSMIVMVVMLLVVAFGDSQDE